MTPLTEYWLKTNLFLLLFYGCYWLLLRRHTFLVLNRVYLLGTLVASFLLPLLQLPGLSLAWLLQKLWQRDIPVEATISAEAGYVTAVADASDSAPLLPDWPVLLTWVFVGGAVLLLLRTGWRVGKLLWQIRQWPAEHLPEYTAVYPPDAHTPTFSFFRYLVLNPADVLSTTVWQHEMGHIRQAHSIDVLIAEMAQALCWPNPALWGYRRALRQTHEFLADRYATDNASGLDHGAGKIASQRDAYARFLVQYAFNLPGGGTAADALTHPFSTNQVNFPTLKQRIQMLYEQHTRRRALWKYALVLPLATALLAMTSKPESAPTDTPPNPESSLATTPSSASLVHVEGVVFDRTGVYPAVKPLSGANIVVHNGHQGTTTDAKGQFTIDVPAGTELVASFVGFEAQVLTVKDVRKPGHALLVFKLPPTAVDGASMPMVEAPASSTLPASGKEVFTVVEQLPTFPGGGAKLYQFLAKNIHYPTEAVQKKVGGKVFLRFVIHPDGHLDQIRVLKGIGFGCDEEAVRVASLMPKWNPGQQNGRAVAVAYSLPINFQIDEPKKVGMMPATDPSDQYTVVLADSSRRSGVTLRLPTRNKVGLGANDPLFYIDGVESTKEDMEKLDKNAIESVNVFKDATAIAQYGEKGRNGVVLITTKAGSTKKR